MRVVPSPNTNPFNFFILASRAMGTSVGCVGRMAVKHRSSVSRYHTSANAPSGVLNLYNFHGLSLPIRCTHLRAPFISKFSRAMVASQRALWGKTWMCAGGSAGASGAASGAISNRVAATDRRVDATWAGRLSAGWVVEAMVGVRTGKSPPHNKGESKWVAMFIGRVYWAACARRASAASPWICICL